MQEVVSFVKSIVNSLVCCSQINCNVLDVKLCGPICKIVCGPVCAVVRPFVVNLFS